MKTKFTNDNLLEIITILEEQFLLQDELSVYKDIHEHNDMEGNFAGDDYVFSIFDKINSSFYFVISPYDDKSKKAPQQALVFREGRLQEQFDYTNYANMRTGAMDALLLRALKLNPTSAKILIYGTGGVAKWTLKFLKAAFPNIEQVDYMNSRNQNDEGFEELGNNIGLRLSLGDKSKIGEFDYIFCHTSSYQPVITKEDLENTKSNVLITSYLTTYNFEEIDISAWDTGKNTVITSWDKEIENSKDLQEAEKSGILEKSKIKTLLEVLSNSTPNIVDTRIMSRSAGTPIQNAALIKYLLSTK
jgi:ornithine cyclodeaminase/alanine dehydrogenase-like protein (mu-crystallin family)